ncbi:hypothetical protein [Mycobacterium asiaticum]|uniref:Uncharacterized protein n=1 Tax=Mycobacterium asiaticum TaxID=1790 RepID=A0A1A3NQF9_MYCAS|nr:hypothetical protein [Mycobacterium asiaticum]OBK22547.1 hypothetical protein A5635_21775 [Mycobacterium asiaticum]
MRAIVDMADRAATTISAALNTDQPDARRRPPTETRLHDKTIRLEEGSPAWNAAEAVHPEDRQILDAAIRLVEPNINHLAAAPAEPHIIWNKHGETRELVEYTGIDIALRLVELHHQARAELGLTRLRHRYPMPCPNCGGRVGRDDGETIITCDDRDNCKSTWTEREYQFLAGLITRERLDMEILKYLLAEAYARLDAVQQRINVLSDIDAWVAEAELPAEAAVIGQLIAESFDEAIAGHLTPAQRAITTARKDTEQRQTSEDTWAWGNEPRYQRPRPKPKKATRPAGPPVHPGSLSTLIDIDETAALAGQIACTECNLTHRGDCA